MNSALFSPLRLRNLVLRNRCVISPMCQYSATEGQANDWHLVQYGRFAVGGAGMVVIEATAVTREGRITPGDLGLWEDAQIAGLARITGFLRARGAASCLQLSHAGRKAASQRPWHGAGPLTEIDAEARGERPWPVIAPSALAVGEGWQLPAAMSQTQIEALVQDYAEAARRALAADFDAIELHVAHGYLLHSFLSPLSNRRPDEYGGGREGRMRLPLRIASLLREIWPVDRPIFARVSAVDGIEGGLELPDTIAFASALKEIGIDLIDCSSGGLQGSATVGRLPRGPGFQLGFAEAVRRESGIATMAVGLIFDPALAEAAIAEGKADLVAIGRAALEDPNWPFHAVRALEGESYAAWPPQHGWWLERRAAILKAQG